jgi:hypothetical protein
VAASGTQGPLGYVLKPDANDAFIAVNRLIAAGVEVRRTPSGLFHVQASADRTLLQKIATDLGVSFETAPGGLGMGGSVVLKKPRIALADQYGGSMPSGWTRWILEQYEFPFEVVFPKVLDAGNLSAKYDVIIFPSGVGPAPAGGGRGGGGGGRGGGGGGGGGGGRGGGPANIPAEFQPMVGSYTAAQTFPALKKFVEDGGIVLAVGRSAMNMAELFELPVGNHLVEKSPDGSSRQIPSEKFYVPGSVLKVTVDTTDPIAHGITNPVDVFFDNSPVFKLDPDAAMKGVRPVAWFDTATPLRSGWAYGQGYLEGGVQIVDATVGRGKVFLFGPEITFRAQPHGTFKFLFNGIYLAGRGASAPTNTAAGR